MRLPKDKVARPSTRMNSWSDTWPTSTSWPMKETTPNFETWYQAIRFSLGRRALRPLGKATKLRYKGVPDTARASKPIGEHGRVAEVRSQ